MRCGVRVHVRARAWRDAELDVATADAEAAVQLAEEDSRLQEARLAVAERRRRQRQVALAIGGASWEALRADATRGLEAEVATGFWCRLVASAVWRVAGAVPDYSHWLQMKEEAEATDALAPAELCAGASFFDEACGEISVNGMPVIPWAGGGQTVPARLERAAMDGDGRTGQGLPRAAPLPGRQTGREP
jgi:hypothetical protein